MQFLLHYFVGLFSHTFVQHGKIAFGFDLKLHFMSHQEGDIVVSVQHQKFQQRNIWAVAKLYGPQPPSRLSIQDTQRVQQIALKHNFTNFRNEWEEK